MQKNTQNLHLAAIEVRCRKREICLALSRLGEAARHLENVSTALSEAVRHLNAAAVIGNARLLLWTASDLWQRITACDRVAASWRKPWSHEEFETGCGQVFANEVEVPHEVGAEACPEVLGVCLQNLVGIARWFRSLEFDLQAAVDADNSVEIARGALHLRIAMVRTATRLERQARLAVLHLPVGLFECREVVEEVVKFARLGVALKLANKK